MLWCRVEREAIMEPTTAAEPFEGLSRLYLDTFGVAACHLVAVAALVLLFVALAPRVVATFADGDMELPATTVMLINLTNWLTGYWYLLVLLLLPDGLAYFGLSRLSPRWSWLASAWAMGWLLATIGLLVVTVVALVLPLVAFKRGRGPSAPCLTRRPVWHATVRHGVPTYTLRMHSAA
jgi:hypothetical protein